VRLLEAWRCGLLLTALLCGAAAGAQTAAEVPSAGASPSASMSAPAVRAAASAVLADPLMPGMEKTQVLRFKQEKAQAKPDADTQWWIKLMGSLSAGLRVAVWLIGAALLILLLLRLRDWLKQYQGEPALPALPPSHVGTLDIRPESLPEDLAQAARALWQQGQTRAALSLLYRAALSRLVHGHGVPIRAASTESECLALASRHLAPAAQAFLAQLVSEWQSVAYAQRPVAPDRLEQLCADFDAQLPAKDSEPAP
jgi:hypothetical protein